MRALVKVLVGVAVVVVLAIAGVIVAILTVDPSTLIAPVQAQVKAATGRDLTVRGGASVALSLRPRVVLTEVALSNPPWAAAKEMVEAKRLELAVELLPLLSRRFELTRVALSGAQVSLETDARGQRSWDFPPRASVPASPAGASGPAQSAVNVGDIEVTDSTMTYRDGASGAVTRVRIERLALQARALSGHLEADFRGVVADVPVTLAGTLGSFESLVNQRWPFPIDVKGEVDGQKVALATKVTAQGKRYQLEDLSLALGANAVRGSFAVDATGARPKLAFDLAAPALVLAAVPVPALPQTPAPAAKPAPGRDYIFPDTPVSFAPLRWVDAQGKLAIDKLTLRDGRQYDNLRMRFALDGGRLDMPDFAVGAFGGTLGGRMEVDASRPEASQISLRLDGKGLSLGEILAAAGRPREVRGGKTDLALELATRGNSPRAWASNATGSVRLVSGPATLLNPKLDMAGTWDKVNEAVNPFRTRDPSTDLVCAVVRFPVAGGVARVDRTIAMETSKLGVSASGTLDFRNETLDFTFQPKVKKGISIDFAGFADLVRVTGPFSAPRMAVDVAGSAKVIASVGAAIGTSGLSAVAQGLLSWADGSGPGPCQIALGAAPAPAATPGSGGGTQNPIAPLTNEVGKALGRLFGKGR